jgi:hypothetical protein
MEKWSSGVIKEWSSGKMEYWSIGKQITAVLEWWSNGVLE